MTGGTFHPGGFARLDHRPSGAALIGLKKGFGDRKSPGHRGRSHSLRPSASRPPRPLRLHSKLRGNRGMSGTPYGSEAVASAHRGDRISPTPASPDQRQPLARDAAVFGKMFHG